MIKLKGNTAKERAQWLRELLTKSSYEVTFTKVDGSVRNMPCTLNSTLIPPAPSVVEGVERKSKKLNPEVMGVWCLDKKEWRSFRIMNVTSIEEI